MRLLYFFFMLLQFGCATKYVVPGNRFMTPESQGSMFHSSLEIQQQIGNQLTADVSKGSVEDGVTTEAVSRIGFLFATSFLEELDLYWSHVGGGNSLLGVKYQLMGTSKLAKGAGHKLAIAAGLGGNQHETDGSTSVEFELKGREFQLLYGYRFDEIILAYSNLVYSRFDFNGEISSNDNKIDGLKPSYQTKIVSLLGGLEFTMGSLFAKVEVGYQRLQTTYTSDEAHPVYGYSLGLTW